MPAGILFLLGPSGVLFLLGLYFVYFLGIYAVLRMDPPSTITKHSQSKKHQKIFRGILFLSFGLLLIFFKPIQGQMRQFIRYHTALRLFYDYHSKNAKRDFKTLFENKHYVMSSNELTSRMVSALQSTHKQWNEHAILLFSSIRFAIKWEEIDPVLRKKLADALSPFLQKQFIYKNEDIAENAFKIMEDLPSKEFISWLLEALPQGYDPIHEQPLLRNISFYKEEAKRLIPLLLKILATRSGENRENLLIVLTELGAKEVLEEVLQILREGSIPSQESILQALELGNIYDESFPPLFAKLFKEVPELRISLLLLFPKLPQMDPELISVVLQNLKTENYNSYIIKDFFEIFFQKENFVSILLQNLPNSHPNVRYLILYFLGIFGNQDALPTLKSYCEDPYPFVATIANWAHFRIQQKENTPISLEELLKSPEKQKCLYALVEIQKNPEIEANTIIPILEELTQREDIQISQQAILSLYTASIDEEENRLKILRPLCKNLKDRKEPIRYSTLWNLAQTDFTKEFDALPILIQYANDPSPDIQELSFSLLDFFQNWNYYSPAILASIQNHVFKIFTLINHSDPSSQKKALLYINKLSSNTNYSVLLQAQSPLIKGQLILIFLKLLETDSELELLLGIKGLAILSPDSNPFFSKIRNLAKHPNPKVRRAVIMTLKYFADPSAIPLIQVALHDPDETVISAALEMLKSFFKPKDPIYQEIFPFLKQKQFRENAAKILGYFAPHPQEFTKVLHDSLLENNEEISKGVLEALWYNRVLLRTELSSFLPFLWERAKKLDSQEQAKFTDILAEIPSQEIIPELQKWCHDKNVAYRRFALETLLKMNTSAKGAREELLDLFENETENTLRILLLKIFKNIPDPKIISQLLIRLPSAPLEEQYKIISTLRILKDPLSIPILLAIAQQEDQGLSLLAKETLTSAFKIDFRWNILQKIGWYFWGTLAGIFLFRFLLNKILFLNSTKE